MKHFANAEDQQGFRRVLKEFAYVLLFMVVLGGLGYVWLDLQEQRTQRLHCNAEEVRSYQTHLAFYQGGHYFPGAAMQSEDFAHSGKYSMKLTKKDAFGFQYEIPALKGNERITASVWRFSNGKISRNGLLVATAPDMWKGGDEVVEKSDDGWEKIQFSFKPPREARNRTLKLYCWNNGIDPIYFDDLSIEITRDEGL